MNAPVHDTLALPMVSGIGKYATDKDGTRPEALRQITFHEVRELVDNPQKVEKASAQWLIPSTHRSRKGHDKHGLRPVIWADVDAPVMTIQQTGEQLRDLLGEVDFEVYASRSATADRQKCRILVPLAQALTPNQWLMVSEVFRVKLRECGIETDPASEATGQILFLPNIGQFYFADHRRGCGLFEPLKGWHAELLFRRQELERQAAEAKKAQEAARQRREALQAARSTSGFKSAIDAFNEAYDVSEVLIRYGYDQRGETFRHPASATGSFSATVRTAADGVRRAHSLSTSDPLYTGGKGGAGAHDAFSAFCVLAHGGDQNAAIKDAGDNWLTIGGESWNKVQRREWAQQQQAIGGVFPAIDLDPETGEPMNASPQAGSLPLDRHPLLEFIKLRKTPQAVKWVIPGVIEQGVVTIAGARGVGKTTALLPLAMAAAGLHERDYPLAPHPDRWRHVIYAVEQVEQAERILSGLVECSGIGITWEQVEERLHLLETNRMDVNNVVKVAGTYREQFTRVVDGVEILPLVVFDTQSASFEMQNENDNAEASRIMAALKQRFEGLPIWIVGHVSKASIGRDDVKALTARGAGAFEADSIANFYLTTDDKDQRFLSIGKRRAEPRFGTDLLIESGDRAVIGFNEWGEPEEVHLRWGIVRPMEQSREELKEEAQEAASKKRLGDMRDAIRNAVQIAWQSGNPLSKNGVKGTVRGFQSKDVLLELEALLAEGWLHEIGVPSARRVHPRKACFLINLDTPEHDAFRSSGTLPADKLVIPQSWRKPEVSIVPEVEPENPEN